MPYETGFVEKKVNGVTQYVSQAASGGAALTFPSNAISYTHVHNNQPKTDPEGQSYDGGVKMLSPVDLLQLITKCSTAATAAGLTPLDVQGVMISNEGIFALTIIDTNISLTQINAGWKEFVSEYNRKSGDIIYDLSLSSSDRSEKLQEMMLDQLEILGLKDKVALFEGEMEMGLNGNKINWTRKTLDTNKKVVTNPC